MSSIVIGIDGGGSKTRAIVADESGKTIVSVEGPGSAVRPGQAEASADVVCALVSRQRDEQPAHVGCCRLVDRGRAQEGARRQCGARQQQ